MAGFETFDMDVSGGAQQETPAITAVTGEFAPLSGRI